MSASVGENELDNALKRALFSQVIPSWSVGMLTVCLCTLLLHDRVSQAGLIWWGVAGLVAGMLRLPLVLRAKQQSDAQLPVKLYTALVALSGLLWGCLALFWSRELQLSDQLVIVLAPSVVCFGGIVSFSPWRPTYQLYAFSIQVPLIVVLAFLEGGVLVRMAIPLLFFLAMCVFLGKRFHYQHRETLSLRLRNQTLVNDLSRQNDSLMVARDDAQAACQIKDEFLARMSHELRTPMNGVLGVSQLLSNTSLDPQQNELMTKLQQSAEGMLDLINNLLDASSLVIGEIDLDKRPYSIAQVVESICGQSALLVENKDLTLNIEIDNDIPQSLIGDERRIRQVLNALIDNAIKFTNAGGVKIQVQRVKNANCAQSDSDNTELLQIVISDTGAGIEQSQLHLVSEFFHQIDGDASRRFGGSGLGLSIAQSLVGLMRGTLSIDSEIAKGTAVIVCVPLLIDPVAEVEHQGVDKINADMSTAQTRALVVEDNLINQLVIEAMLEDLSCEVTVAENGLVALSMLDAHEFDIVFMDCQMPELDGYGATVQAREKGYQLPIVAVTANSMPGDRQKCLSAGMNDYVSKPFTADTITYMLDKWTGRVELQLAV